MTRERDAFDLFDEGRRERSRFGDNELRQDGDRVTKSNLCDLDLILHNDNPGKLAIAVSLRGDTPFAQWVWLARSIIEYERTGVGVNGSALVRVTLPERVAKEKGLV
jgi:hypothetical protein